MAETTSQTSQHETAIPACDEHGRPLWVPNPGNWPELGPPCDDPLCSYCGGDGSAYRACHFCGSRNTESDGRRPPEWRCRDCGRRWFP